MCITSAVLTEPVRVRFLIRFEGTNRASSPTKVTAGTCTQYTISVITWCYRSEDSPRNMGAQSRNIFSRTCINMGKEEAAVSAMTQREDNDELLPSSPE